MLRDLGYAVAGISRTIGTAHLAFANRNFDGVLLDLNLDGEYHPELADLLLQSSIPFAFITGYDYLVEPRTEKIPLLQKPFPAGQLDAVLKDLLGTSGTLAKEGTR